MTEIAGVLAAKGLFDGGYERIGLGEIDGHSYPGNRLQQCPVTPENADEREHDNAPGKTPQHVTNILTPFNSVKVRDQHT
ncbi:MAG: hypothetical protein L0Y58_03180, partial [Verrucomicrobia subdivision 3 bacterium]|nr:hypothetical protein [Limisphaerales bacterium]